MVGVFPVKSCLSLLYLVHQWLQGSSLSVWKNICSWIWMLAPSKFICPKSLTFQMICFLVWISWPCPVGTADLLSRSLGQGTFYHCIFWNPQNFVEYGLLSSPTARSDSQQSCRLLRRLWFFRSSCFRMMDCRSCWGESILSSVWTGHTLWVVVCCSSLLIILLKKVMGQEGFQGPVLYLS